MKNLFATIRTVVAVSILSGCAPEFRYAADTTARSPTPQQADQHFLEWLDQEFAAELDFSPLAKTRLGDKSDYDKLDDVSETGLARRLAWQRDSVSRMESQFSRAALTPPAQLSWDLWRYRFEMSQLRARYQRHDFVFGRFGPQSVFPRNLINFHDVADIADAQAYVARLRSSGRYMRQYLVRAQAAAGDGIRAPYFDYDRTVREINKVLRGAPFSDQGSSALWRDFSEKVDALVARGRADAEMARVLKEQARQALLEEFQPAYLEILAWIESDRINVSDAASGAWSLPDGEDYYAARLKIMTTLPLSAQDIHATGTAEVTRIQNEMGQIQAQVGHTGSLQEFFEFMRNDPQFYLPDTAAGRSKYLALADRLLADMYDKLPDYFGILPKAGLQVRRVESFREQAGGSAHYVRGTPDGSRQGTFYVHLADMRALAVNRLESLCYHEGVPGHHMQISIQQEQTQLPYFRRVSRFTAFSEGWGLYAEYLGKEMGGYSDPYADFGRLSSEIWRAIRLVVDTGIHAMRWTETQAVEYALANSPRPELAVRAEVRRYFNNPGQATAYKIGMLKIIEYRTYAESRLGERFDIRAFHDLVLGSGQLPMISLQTQIESWVEAQLAGK